MNPPIGHFTVMDGSEAEGDLVLSISEHNNNLIYIIKQEGLFQNKVTLSLASIHNFKMAYCSKVIIISNRYFGILIFILITTVFVATAHARVAIMLSF